jgi:hypothetical protein
VSNEELVAALTAAGHFPQVLEIESWSPCGVVETARTFRTAPLIRTFKDRQGRWVLTVFGEEYYHVPNETDVPEATIDMLRAMDRAMNFSPEVIRNHGLIELPPSEFPDDVSEAGDE